MGGLPTVSHLAHYLKSTVYDKILESWGCKENFKFGISSVSGFSNVDIILKIFFSILIQFTLLTK